MLGLRLVVVPAAALSAFGALLVSPPVAAQWHIGLSAKSGIPGGYAQVRENAIEGTPLHFRSDLGVSRVRSLALSAKRRMGKAGALHLTLVTTQLSGTNTLKRTAWFNGTTLAPGPISSATRFQDFWRLQASYWRTLAHFPDGGLWVSAGLTFVSLNLRLHARIAANSVGHETKEDFNTQELPIPIIGVHMRYRLLRGLTLFADVDGGHLPWTNSLRREGGMVQLTQTNEDARIGLRYRTSGAWSASLYAYATRYEQNERSAEDGNYVRLNQHGFGLTVDHRF